MAQGLRAAGPGHYVVFTDADIAWAAHTLRRLVAAAEGDDRDLVSQMALLRTATGWERVVVPAFVYFFAQLYPFRRVNVPGSRTAAAAGGCMLIRRGALEAATIARGQLLKPYPYYSSVTVPYPHLGTSLYNAFLLSIERLLGRFGIEFRFAHFFRKSSGGHAGISRLGLR